MRIGIVTHPAYINYGGILQAYALQTTLEKLGHEVWKIEKPYVYPHMSKAHRVFSICKRVVMKYFFQKDVIIDIDAYACKKTREAMQNTRKFAENHLNIKISENMSQYSDFFDCLIAGSDQVWRYYGNVADLYHYYLDFAVDWNVKRIGYAVSFGNDTLDYPDNILTECKKLAAKFDMVTVREKSGVDVCKKYLHIDARQILDPTMLLTLHEYTELFKCDNEGNETKTKDNKQLACYILDNNNEKQTVIAKVADNYGLNVKYISAQPEKDNEYFDWLVQPSVESWLQNISEAEYVVTDSFHGCVFSILFNKPFVAIVNKQRGEDRFVSLLSLFDLNDRLVKGDNVEISKLHPIDWTIVNEKLKILREESLNYLSKYLQN